MCFGLKINHVLQTIPHFQLSVSHFQAVCWAGVEYGERSCDGIVTVVFPLATISLTCLIIRTIWDAKNIKPWILIKTYTHWARIKREQVSSTEAILIIRHVWEISHWSFQVILSIFDNHLKEKWSFFLDNLSLIPCISLCITSKTSRVKNQFYIKTCMIEN